MNGAGSFVFRAERVGKDTLLSQIIRLVNQAQRSRAPIQRLADQVSSYFIPAVLVVALGGFLFWYRSGLDHSLMSAVAVLMIACPCALGLATPMSILVATGRAAQLGILFKDAQALELFARVDTLIVDKTGTLTLGKPQVVSIHPEKGVNENEVLVSAAALEALSEHPLAAAILDAARKRSLEIPKVEGFESKTGLGVSGQLGSKRIRVGSPKYLGVQTALESQGRTVIGVSEEGRLLGFLQISDALKPSTPQALKELRADGVRIVMMTGDHQQAALSVARELGMDETDVHAQVSPAQKQDLIRRLQTEGHRVAMAGDGVNDSPALAQADVGIAMGTGTDVAIESAGVTLVRGDLLALSRARSLSRATLKNIRQNLFFAFIYNGVGVPVAAALLLSPMMASAAMSLSSVSVIGNALRLRSAKI